MKLPVLLFSLLGSAAVFANTASEQLLVNIGGKVPALLIPATTYSCMEIASGSLNGEGSIKKNYFRLPSPDLKWTGDKNSSVAIDMIRFTMNAPQVGQYECIHSGTKLGSLFYRTTTDANGKISVNFWNGILGQWSYGSTSAEVVAQGFNKCELICGGVNFPQNSGKFMIDGKWELYAVERKYSSSNELLEENPIYKKGNFKVSKDWED